MVSVHWQRAFFMVLRYNVKIKQEPISKKIVNFELGKLNDTEANHWNGSDKVKFSTQTAKV
jgi:hypothetical protein